MLTHVENKKKTPGYELCTKDSQGRPRGTIVTGKLTTKITGSAKFNPPASDELTVWSKDLEAVRLSSFGSFLKNVGLTSNSSNWIFHSPRYVYHLISQVWYQIIRYRAWTPITLLPPVAMLILQIQSQVKGMGVQILLMQELEMRNQVKTQEEL